MGISAYVFDAHGTVFDLLPPPRAAATCSARPTNALTVLWRDKQLQYTGLRAVRGRHADFWQVTVDALAFALETLGLIETGLRDQLLQLYLRLTAPGQAATIALGSILHGKLVERLAAAALDHAGLMGPLPRSST